MEELIKLLVEGLESGFAVAMEQAPVLCEEILAYGFMQNVFTIIISLIILISSITLFYKSAKYFWNIDEINDGWLPVIFFGSIFLFIIIIISSICIIASSLSLIKIQCAPKLYIIDQLRGKK